MAEVTYVKFADLQVGVVYTITNHFKYYNKFGQQTITIDLEGPIRLNLPQWFAKKHFDDDFLKDKKYFCFKGMEQCKGNTEFSYAKIEFPSEKV